MRKLLLLLLLSTTSFAFSSNPERDEPYYNFLIVDEEVIWQKVYETDLSESTIISYFKENGKFDIISEEDNTLILNLKKIPFNYKKFTSLSNIPLPMRQDATAYIVIHTRGGKYRVTVSNVIFHVLTSTQMMREAVGRYHLMELEIFAYNIKKNQYSKFFKNNTAEPLSKVFDDMFNINNRELINDDW